MKPLPIATAPAVPREIPRDVALLHADGALPNLALMRLSTYFKERGARVQLVRRGVPRSLWDGHPVAFGSSIFTFSAPTRAWFDREWGPVVWGGTGLSLGSNLREIDPSINWDAVAPDYSLYPHFAPSLGFSQRGCRLECEFCGVPKKEGRPRAVGAIADIWRGEAHPKRIVLLDNDFFGVPEWRERVRELCEGKFKVAFSQGINVRLVNDEAAKALASLQYRDNEFQERVLYTAWDNLGDERIFLRGVKRLKRAGIPPKHLRVYMLVGFDETETFDRLMYRFELMAGRLSVTRPGPFTRKSGARPRAAFAGPIKPRRMGGLGCEPFPMVYDNARHPPGLAPDRTLKHFQRYVLRGLYRAVAWKDYDPHIKATRAEARRAAEETADANAA